MNFRQLMGSLALCALMALPAGKSFADVEPAPKNDPRLRAFVRVTARFFSRTAHNELTGRYPDQSGHIR